MLINSSNNIQLNTSFETKDAYFSLHKQSSEVAYQQQKDNNTHSIFNYQTNKDDDTNPNNTITFDGYYNMFIASQELQKSEVLNNYNYQMYMKKYA